MNILVNLTSKIHSFQLTQRHQTRLCAEFPQHDFDFASSYKDFENKLAAAEIALVWFFPEKLFASAPKLQTIYTPAAGKEWLAVDSSGRVETRFSSFHGTLMAESFLSMLLYFNNNLARAADLQSAKDWNRNFPGRHSLQGQKLLIAGCGGIGRKCGEVASAFGMKVCGVRREPAAAEFEMITPQQMEGRLGEFQHVLNLLPGGEATKKFFNNSRFAALSSQAYFYNFGRGTTVCEESLIEALQDGRLAGAGLDVTAVEPLPQESPLWQMPNVLLTPHSSCCYDDYLDMFIDELKSCDFIS